MSNSPPIIPVRSWPHEERFLDRTDRATPFFLPSKVIPCVNVFFLEIIWASAGLPAAFPLTLPCRGSSYQSEWMSRRYRSSSSFVCYVPSRPHTAAASSPRAMTGLEYARFLFSFSLPPPSLPETTLFIFVDQWE